MKEHPIHKGYYLTPDGRIFSDWSKPSRWRKRTDTITEKSQRLVSGYYTTEIREKSYLLHRLVLETYRPTNDPSLIVNHIDRDKTNNHIDNLEWTTQRDNVIHGFDITYQILTPEGNIETTHNLKGWCQERGLNSINLLHTYKERYQGTKSYQKTHRGYIMVSNMRGVGITHDDTKGIS